MTSPGRAHNRPSITRTTTQQGQQDGPDTAQRCRAFVSTNRALEPVVAKANDSADTVGYGPPMPAPPRSPALRQEPIASGMPSRILLTRHGETEWNRVGRRQGQLDSPLTDNGKGHARNVADLCCDLEADAVFSSPLGGARATAIVVAERLSVQVVVLEDLSEIDHGDVAGLANNEIEARHPGELARRAMTKYTWTFPGGESYADADIRAKAAISRVASSGADSPVIVAHEMIARMLLRSPLRLDPDEALKRSVPHGSVIETLPVEARAKTHTT